MKLSEREKWMFILTVMKTSKTGKSMTLDMQVGVCEFLRERLCPSISHESWKEMEYDIREIKAQVMELMFKGMEVASGKSTMSPEAREMFSEMDLAKLDSKVKNTLKKIDFDQMKKSLTGLPKDKQDELQPLFEAIESLTGEYNQRDG
jgi:hypothetical protein